MAFQVDGPTYTEQSQILAVFPNPSGMQSNKHLFRHSQAARPRSKLTRDLLALPVRHGGMGLMNRTDTSHSIHYFQTSEMVTSPPTEIILSQDQTKDVDPTQIAMAPSRKRSGKQTAQEMKKKQTLSYNELPPQLKHQIDLAKERGSSSWLSVLPLSEQGFHLHKGEFRDAVCLRYGCMGTRISTSP